MLPASWCGLASNLPGGACDVWLMCRAYWRRLFDVSCLMALFMCVRVCVSVLCRVACRACPVAPLVCPVEASA